MTEGSIPPYPPPPYSPPSPSSPRPYAPPTAPTLDHNSPAVQATAPPATADTTQHERYHEDIDDNHRYREHSDNHRHREHSDDHRVDIDRHI